MDRVAGDGDLGASMRRAAVAVQNTIGSLPLSNVSELLRTLGDVLQREMGGTSGPLYGVLFLRCGNVLENSRAAGLAGGLKESIRAARPSATWVVRSPVIGPCWMLSPHL